MGSGESLAEAFGAVLRELRKSAGLTQEGLAAESGVDPTFISLMERGRNKPTIEILFKLAKGLKMRPYELVQALEARVNA